MYLVLTETFYTEILINGRFSILFLINSNDDGSVLSFFYNPPPNFPNGCGPLKTKADLSKHF